MAYGPAPADGGAETRSCLSSAACSSERVGCTAVVGSRGGDPSYSSGPDSPEHVTGRVGACIVRDECSLHSKIASSRESPTRVRFQTPLVTAVWEADIHYDRRSIVVDLSKTPFALFRKDALLMARPPAMAATSPSPKTGPLKPTGPPRRDTTVCAESEGRADGAEPRATSANCGVAGRIRPSRVEGSTRCRSDVFGSWDSEESDCSGVTDTETDAEHSDTDSNPCPERRSVEPAFFGVWKRTGSEGYEALLLASGVSKRAVATAVRKRPIHIIDHDGQYFRLIVKNGLSKVDNTFFIGDEPRVVSDGLFLPGGCDTCNRMNPSRVERIVLACRILLTYTWMGQSLAPAVVVSKPHCNSACRAVEY